MPKKMSRLASLTALGFVFSYIEFLLPFHVGVPGVKLGLANLVVILALYLWGFRQALAVSLLRILLVGFTFGGLYPMLYGLIGGLLSLAVMCAAKRGRLLGMTGVSVLGAVSHNVGQILVAVAVTNTLQITYYLPILIVSGIITGAVIGLLAGACLKSLRFERASEPQYPNNND